MGLQNETRLEHLLSKPTLKYTDRLLNYVRSRAFYGRMDRLCAQQRHEESHL